MRLDRARKHFEDLETACNRFMRHDPDTAGGIDLKLDSDVGEAIGTIAIPGDFPAEMGALVGEALYHLRSALDNLAWQLVLANGGSPGSHTEFPVFKDEAEFRWRGKNKMRGMHARVRASIEALQPFNEWPKHPAHSTLWLIHDLNRIDKHRLPHIACVWLAHVNTRLVPPGDVDAKGVYVAPIGPIEDGAKVFHFTWDPVRMKALEGHVEVEIDVSTDIAIKSGEISFLLSEGGEPAEAMPVRKLFNTAFDYMQSRLLPIFAPEFKR